MTKSLSKQSIIKKTVQVGIATLGSRVLGIVRELLMVRYLGAGVMADAFVTAWKAPNMMRKVFAEGALSAAFIPMLVRMVKEGKKDDANGLMSLGFLVFEGAVLVLCALIVLAAPWVVWFMAPGFSQEQIELTVPLLRILISFLFFVSSSALFAGALQSVNHFFVPAFSPILLNIVFIGALLFCLAYKLPATYLCYFILAGGALQFAAHLIAFWRLKFSFGQINPRVKKLFKEILVTFGACLLSMSGMELGLFIDTQFSSYLTEGTTAVLYYANRFMGIPMGVFVTAFSTVLLPHFSRVITYAPKRLSFYLYEATKLIIWVTVPMTFFMIFFARDIFITLFLSDTFPLDKVAQASTILMVFMAGLFFFSMNRVLLNLYYAQQNMFVPTVVSFIGAFLNAALNWLLVHHLQATGLALATVLSAAIQAGLYVAYLYYYKNFTFYFSSLASFLLCYALQLSIVLGLFVTSYYLLFAGINLYLPIVIAYALCNKIYFWLWVGPLCAAVYAILYYTRRSCNVKVYFLD